MEFKLSEMLQKDTPSNKWLVKDNNKTIIRAQSINIKNSKNLNGIEIDTMNKLIDFVRYSQDDKLNFKLNNNDYLRPAVGLAAPQIGRNINMFYIRVDYKDGSETKEIAAINAKIIASSVQVVCLKNGEGCLSVDGDKSGFVQRKHILNVEYYDFFKKLIVTEKLKGYEAIVFQHELDHINGVLYYDHIDKENPNSKNEDWLYI